ncbi:MAG TPA: winged helix-turn-helix domain-containing protein [Pirellulaceae bacterium]|nr:winged helix-turn-helix domain-containing protein [Pirellulaceae bacterium]
MNQDCVLQIGDLAGIVWKTLDENGPLSLAKLVKHIDAPRDTIMQALGWLAREDKLTIEDTNRGKIVSLRSE